jgi:hypothetical protein
MSVRIIAMEGNQARIFRWGGCALGIGAAIYGLAIVAYVLLYGQPDATNPDGIVTLNDRVRHLEANWNIAEAIWWFEIVAILLLAFGSFILQHQECDQHDKVPPRIAWLTVAIGSIFLFMMYPLMLGGYPEAMGFFENEPGLMAVLNSVAFFIFYVGNAVLFLGLGLAFTLGSTATGGMRSWVTTTGAVLCLVGLVGMIGGLLGVSVMTVLAPFGLIATLLSSYLGYSIWRAGARPGQ